MISFFKLGAPHSDAGGKYSVFSTQYSERKNLGAPHSDAGRKYFALRLPLYVSRITSYVLRLPGAQASRLFHSRETLPVSECGAPRNHKLGPRAACPLLVEEALCSVDSRKYSVLPRNSGSTGFQPVKKYSGKKCAGKMPELPKKLRLHRAFTLMELLIVIAVIGILISLLLPSLSQARKKAMNGVCLSNLRQLAVATITYDTSNQALMYRGKGGFARRGYLRSSEMKENWGVFAIHYLGAPDGSQDTQNPGDYGTALRFYSSDAFHCPLNPVERANSGDAAKGRITNTNGSNYGFFSGSTNDISFNIMKLQAKFEDYQSDTGRDLGSSIALWGDVCNRDPNDNSNWAFRKTNHKKAYKTAPTSKEEADQLVEGGNVAHADGSVKRYGYSPPTWATGTYSAKQTGSLNWDFVNPTTAMYPSVDYPSGNFSTAKGYIVGPFSKSGP